MNRDRRAVAGAAVLLAAVLGLAWLATGGPASATASAAQPTCGHGHWRPPCPTPTTTDPSPTTTDPTPTETSPTATETTPSASVCTSPYVVLTGPGAGISDGGYYVHNNMWNAYSGTSQSLAVCSFRSWNTTVTAHDGGDHAVQTYPNVHKDYHDWGTGYEPPLSNYPVLSGSWAMTAPAVGVYDVAWDIWLNGVPGNREIMIWTENRGQTPAGSVVASGLTFPGSYTGTWDLWATSTNGILSLVPAGGQVLPSGSIDLRAVLDYLIGAGRVPSTSTLGQVDFGVEVVDTGGSPATFNVTDFSITDS